MGWRFCASSGPTARDDVVALVDAPDAEVLDDGEAGLAVAWRRSALPNQQVHRAGGRGWWGVLAGDVSSDADTVHRALAGLASGASGPLGELRGPWAAVVVDTASGRVSAATDPLALRPLYVAQRSGVLSVCSAPMPLRELPDMDRDVDWDVVALTLAQRDAPVGHTLLRGVGFVPGGHVVRATVQGVPSVRPWFVWPDAVDTESSFDEWVERLGPLFTQAVRRCAPDGPVGVSLSGGLDSSLIAAVLHAEGLDAQAVALTLRQPESRWSENAYQDEMMAMLGWPEITTDPLPGGTYVAGLERTHGDGHFPLPWYEVEWAWLDERASEQGIDVVLAGQGGDEEFDPARPDAWDLAASGRLGAAVDEVRHGQTDWRKLIKRPVKELAPPSVLRRRRALPAWAGPAMADTVARAEASQTWKPSVGVDAVQRGWAELMWRSPSSQRQSAWVGAVSDVATTTHRWPFKDLDMVMATCALPATTAHRGRWRGLQRALLPPQVPESVRRRQWKTPMDEVVQRKLAHGELGDLWRAPLLGERGLVDPDVLASSAAGRLSDMDATGGLTPLSLVAGMEHWLGAVP